MKTLDQLVEQWLLSRAPKPKAEVPVGEMTLSAIVTRADGTVEDLGVISRGPLTFKTEKGK